MSYLTIEVEIDHGRIVAREPEKLPEKGNGLLTILQPVTREQSEEKPRRHRVELPLIRGDGQRIINPTPRHPRNSMPVSGVIKLTPTLQSISCGPIVG
jgi:hypothetical protein